MTRLITPAFGPHCGVLCRRLDDGTLVPMAALPEGYEPPLSVAVPDVVPSDGEPKYRRGLEGAARQIFESEHKGRSDGQSFEQVKTRVVEARRISGRKQQGG